jgi:hypothetical protein
MDHGGMCCHLRIGLGGADAACKTREGKAHKDRRGGVPAVVQAIRSRGQPWHVIASERRRADVLRPKDADAGQVGFAVPAVPT